MAAYQMVLDWVGHWFQLLVNGLRIYSIDSYDTQIVFIVSVHNRLWIASHRNNRRDVNIEK